MKSFISTSALPLCLLMSACGGGGDSGVASIPPPPVAPMPVPTPTPAPAPTPIAGPPAEAYSLTRAGTYDLLGRLQIVPKEGAISSRVVDPGDFSITVSRPSAAQGFAYQLNGPPGFIPGGSTSVEYGPGGSWYSDVNGNISGDYSRTLRITADQNLLTVLKLYAGYSYVSMGEWAWDFVHLDGGTAGGYGSFLFVSGDRTPTSGIPVSGTATYDARTLSLLSSNLIAGIPFTLTADFGQRTISTAIDQNYRYNPTGDIMDYAAPGIHVSGSAPFSSSGTFDIPLSGTGSVGTGYAQNLPQTPASQAVTGNMNGAFFGPHAEQVGGTFSLRNSGGATLMQDAFVGQQRH